MILCVAVIVLGYIGLGNTLVDFVCIILAAVCFIVVAVINLWNRLRGIKRPKIKNNAVLNDPKYRIRGFFPIPAPKYRDNNVLFNPEEIIQFWIKEQENKSIFQNKSLNFNDKKTIENCLAFQAF